MLLIVYYFNYFCSFLIMKIRQIETFSYHAFAFQNYVLIIFSIKFQTYKKKMNLVFIFMTKVVGVCVERQVG